MRGAWLCAACVVSAALPATPLVYTATNGETFDVADCGYGNNPNSKVNVCERSRAVMEPFQIYIDQGMSHANTKGLLCPIQSEICKSLPENQGNSEGCQEVYSGCQQALWHLQKMMFNPDGEEQVCNNFARKSVRGFFHDFMSNAIDGSILSETTIAINFGLCRWAQYINVLSDQTMCDPGSIIAMAGQLGYEACGVKVWEFDFNTKPSVKIGRAHPCGQHLSKELFDLESKQRWFKFSDTQAAANSTAMEEFWYTLNSHTHGRPDGEAEYSGEASAHAHAIGRVTCQPDGVDENGDQIDFQKGFFHVPRKSGMDVTAQFNEALNKISQTQCAYGDDGEKTPTGGMRLNTDAWEVVEGETDMNPEGGLCGMPTQFLGTVGVGGRHRTPRWIAITQNSAKRRPEWSVYQARGNGGCTSEMDLFIPWELLNISDHQFATSPALARFEAIAWDGHDRIDSEWDSCELECANPVLANRLCGADPDAAPQLQDFDWTKPWCDAATGVLNNDGYTCCSAACGSTCQYDKGTCADRTGGASQCCPNTIRAANRECTSYWDTGCVVPKMGEGGACAVPSECASQDCRGGLCCGKYGQSEGCTACDVSGHCAACSTDVHEEPRADAVGGGTCSVCSFELRGPECVSSCECREGCAACDCGTCNECEDSHYLEEGACKVKRGSGAKCTVDNNCVKGRCAGGNCCDVDVLEPGCTDCNFRGLCEECDTAGGYTLCEHHNDGQGYGQCNVTIPGDRTTSFICGMGADGDKEGHRHSFSSDGGNYCAGQYKCPCDASGCYKQCNVMETCWVGSNADVVVSDYVPVEFAKVDEESPVCTGTDHCKQPSRWRGRRILPP